MADEKLKMLEKAIVSTDWDDVARKCAAALENERQRRAERCAQGDHADLECWNLSGGWIHWRCRDCGVLISERDRPMTI